MSDESRIPVLILHGWGLQASLYSKLALLFDKKKYQVYALDLPGFGEEPLKNSTMVLDDYVDFVESFLKKHNFSKVIIIGHSFGGRVGVKFAWKYPKKVTTLILTGVPILRHVPLHKKIAYIFAVVGGKVFTIFPAQIKQTLRKILYFGIGEWDYYKAGPLQQVFKNIIREDLVHYVKELHVPVILVWGADDRLTPASDVKKIVRFIPQAKHVVIPGIGHKLPYENPKLLYNAIEPFI